MGDEKANSRILGYSLISAAGFVLFIAYVFIDKAGLLYFFWVLPFAYIATFIALLTFVAESRGRLLVVSSILLSTLAVVAVISVLTVSRGYPFPYQSQFQTTSCTEVQIPNATSPSGHTNGTQCSTSPPTTETSSLAFLWNYFYWLPVSGLAMFTIPTWRKGKNVSERAGYAVIGLVLMTALILPLIGIPFVGS